MDVRLNIISLIVLSGLVVATYLPQDAPPQPAPKQIEDRTPAERRVDTSLAGAGFLSSPAGYEGQSEAQAVDAGHPPDPDECFACHDDDTFTMERAGEEILIFVDPELYDESHHGGVDCLDCHVGYDPYEEPHRENPLPVDCSECHEQSTTEFAVSPHAGETNCASCHGDPHIPAEPISEEETCYTCHEDAGADLAMSAHAGNDSAPTCLTCHGAHDFEAAPSETCVTCHGEEDFVGDHVAQQDFEDIQSFAESIHADLIECSDCHSSHLVLPSDDPRSAVSRQNISQTCAECHDDVAEVYETSEHGQALAEGFEFAPACTDCHGEHDIHLISDPESPMSRSKEVQVCLSCHLESPEVQERMTHTGGFIAGFEASVHGRAAAAGNEDAAVCSDCHGGHEAMKASNPEARINQFNISETCGTCHEDQHETFDESIHGVALERGIQDAPTCTTCHAEHEILAPDDPESPVSVINISQEVCAPCHESSALSEKYGFPSDRTTSFSDSYHGLAGRFGSAESANCSSCHGIHDIWPSSDPRSKVHPANIQETCGSCHPGATANFAKGSVHVTYESSGNRLLYWISTIYFWVIVVIIGSMTVHNTLDWTRKTMIRYRATADDRPREHALSEKGESYVRMTLNERIQHATLGVSFIILVITGFMLKFPEAWWVVGLRNIVGEPLFELRGIVHRVAGVVMIASGLYHLYYAAFTSRGRQLIKDLWFSKKDWTDLVQMIKFYLGRSPERPQFDRFNYVEKSEYWALIWGSVIMSATGIVLWFENHFMAGYSKLFIDVNETIHYYEAWLAFLAIVVWHFYYVIFNPDAYPMNFTWITGRISEQDMKHEHPLELERIREAESAGDEVGDEPEERE